MLFKHIFYAVWDLKSKDRWVRWHGDHSHMSLEQSDSTGGKHFKVCLKKISVWSLIEYEEEEEKEEKKAPRTADCSVRLKWCGFTSGLRSVIADFDPEVIQELREKKKMMGWGGSEVKPARRTREKNWGRPPEWQATAEFTHLETWTRPPLPSSFSSIARVFTHTQLSKAGLSHHRFTFFLSLSLSSFK